MATQRLSPTVEPIKPLATRYLTDGDGEEYVGARLSLTQQGLIRHLYIARKELHEPYECRDFLALGGSVSALPMVSGLSTNTCRVGDTIYITGTNVWKTLDNAVMISGTGLMAPHDSELRELEFP